MRIRNVIGVAALAVQPLLVGAAQGAVNPKATVITVPCGVLNAVQGNGKADPDAQVQCKDIKSTDGNGDADDQNSVELFSGGVLVATETNASIFVVKGDGGSGMVAITLTGNNNAANFHSWYEDPATSWLNSPDLTVKVLQKSGSKKSSAVVLYQNYSPVGSALWAEHSGDAVAINGQIAQIQADIAAHEAADQAAFAAEAAARAAADTALQTSINQEIARAKSAEASLQTKLNNEIDRATTAEGTLQTHIDSEVARATAAEQAETARALAAEAALGASIGAVQTGLNNEIAARMAADAVQDASIANLNAALAAESQARMAGDAATLTAANAYTDAAIAALPWPKSCPVGQEIVSTGNGTWACADDSVMLPSCPAGDANTQYFLQSAGNGSYVCRAYCSNTFVDTTTDKNNCGSCGNVCNPPQNVNNTMCVNSGCAISACNANALDCDGQFANGCECANLPNATPACGQGGSCQIAACNQGFADCNNNPADGCEVNLQSDNANCNACGAACAQGLSCSGGACVAFNGFAGIQQNVPIATLAGWNMCFIQAYGVFGPALAQIQAQCSGGDIMLACRTTGNPVLQLAAWAPRADVFFDTGDGTNNTHLANNVFWYFSQSTSMGFSPNNMVSRNSCDTTDGGGFFGNPGGTGDFRLCWHTGGGQMNGGWRCGQNNGLNGEPSGYEKVMFQAN